MAIVTTRECLASRAGVTRRTVPLVTITRTVEPSEVGLNARRLARIDAHFAQYVDSGKLAGWHIVVTRRGEVAYSSTYGRRDIETGAPVTADTLWRIYSMTKPVTSVAAMMLWEEGRFELTDEISTWLPEFANPRVYDKGSLTDSSPCRRPSRSGSGTCSPTPADSRTASCRRRWLTRSTAMPGMTSLARTGSDLAAACQAWANLPLLFQPGSRWGYSVGHRRPRPAGRGGLRAEPR